jgi:hypothetical protein
MAATLKIHDRIVRLCRILNYHNLTYWLMDGTLLGTSGVHPQIQFFKEAHIVLFLTLFSFPPLFFYLYINITGAVRNNGSILRTDHDGDVAYMWEDRDKVKKFLGLLLFFHSFIMVFINLM